MARNPLKFPPDDIGEWHQIPVPYQGRLQFKTTCAESRFYQIKQWLRNETTGPYYVKSNCVITNGKLSDVYCFCNSADAVMFSMLWS